MIFTFQQNVTMLMMEGRYLYIKNACNIITKKENKDP